MIQYFFQGAGRFSGLYQADENRGKILRMFSEKHRERLAFFQTEFDLQKNFFKKRIDRIFMQNINRISESVSDFNHCGEPVYERNVFVKFYPAEKHDTPAHGF